MWLGSWSTGALWTIVVAGIAGTSCALVGSFLVLRRMSMLGDAISHAVLPGIALSVLWTGQIGGATALIGALVCGILTTLLVQWAHTHGRLTEDSAMGVVFTSMFAIGVIIISREARRKHIDADCVLYGLIEAVQIDTVSLAGWEVPRALLTLGPVLLVVVGFMVVFWKELTLASFDPALATSMGFSAGLMHYLLMGMVAGVTVAAFEAVGSILVIALLIVPAVTAHQLTDRLLPMLLIAVAVAWICAAAGYQAALALDTSMAGMVAVMTGVCLLLSILGSPRHGIISKVYRQSRLAARIAAEDVLARLYRQEESKAFGRSLPAPRPKRIGRLTAAVADFWLRRQQYVVSSAGGGIELTDAGRDHARDIIRSHRLWESFLDTHFRLPPDHLHEAAEQMEHFIGPELQEKLESELEDPMTDPHGRTIPQSATNSSVTEPERDAPGGQN